MHDHELRTLRALTARLVPGPPEDPHPGALDVGAAESIARLLAAFEGKEPPPIHARRDGGFVALDAVAELGWRIRIEGSRGLSEREFAGPVTGLAQRVADGLEQLDRAAREALGVAFADATVADQDALLGDADDAFLALVLDLTLDAVYGPAQYRQAGDTASWRALGWPGFTQPVGFTAAQVSEPDGDGTVSADTLDELQSELGEDAGWRSG